MHDNDYKAMYNKAVFDTFRGQFQFLDERGRWQPCQGYWPENVPGRLYRYLTNRELLQEQKPLLYDKNTFLATMLGNLPMWVRLTNFKDMLLVAGIANDGIRIHDVGYKSWKSLANENWQWAQFTVVKDYNDLIWKPFTRE